MACVSIYFQRLVPLGEYEAGDGKALGQDLLWKTSSSKTRIKKFEEVLMKSRALKDLNKELPWPFEAMMVPALRGNLNMNIAVNTKMLCLSEEEAIRIGKNLIPALKSKKLVSAGVDQWRVQNKAVKEIVENHEWFLPMMVEVSKGIVKTAAWGLMFRVTLGAVLSMSDLATDLFVLKQFWDRGEETLAYRNASLASLSSSVGLQLMFVALQNRKKGFLRIVKEIMIVLTGLKGPWDAYRVAIGAEQEEDTLLDPMMEMTCTKCIELFAESIPGIIIQLSAIVSTMNSGEKKEVTMTAYLSLLVSVLTTAFTSATISYDYDTDPRKRAFNPYFYGYVPDDGRKRAFLFLVLVLLTAVQILIKAALIIVLGSIGSRLPFHYLLGDMTFYLLYKVTRRDFTYWLPLEGVLSLVISISIRVVVKVVVDFAAIIHFRHPNEVSDSTILSMQLN